MEKTHGFILNVERFGQWQEANNRPHSTLFVCSECGKTAYYIHGREKICGYRFCPNCGVRMGENEKDETIV